MDPCNVDCVTILRYLANELSGPLLEEFSAHLKNCTECRAHLENEQRLSRLLLRVRPLYSAPEALRTRVSAMFAGHSGPNRAQEGF
jgi:predicted anti-sigma-YlaC factor YlaD